MASTQSALARPARGRLAEFDPTVEGHYAYQGLLRSADGAPLRGGDLGVFQDDDGTAYLLETEGRVYQLSPDYKSVLTNPVARPITLGQTESPALFKANGTYFFLTSKMT